MRREAGSITTMTIGFVLLIGLLTVVVVDASVAFLARQQLMNLADSAALAAADGLDEEGFYADREVVLSEQIARDRAREQLAGEPATALVVDVVDDRVRVRLTREVSLPLVPPGWDGTTTVTADVSAQLRATFGN